MEKSHEISFGQFEASKDQAKLMGKMRERIVQAIAKLREELGYKSEWDESLLQSYMPLPPMPKFAQEKADWLVENGEVLNERLGQLCLALHLPEHYASGLRMFFLTGSDFYLQFAETAPFDFAVRVDLGNDPWPDVHEVYRWLPHEERDRPKLLRQDLDFIVRGSLETFTAQGWGRLGSYITAIKKAAKAGRFYRLVPGRPADDTLALECARLKDQEGWTLVRIGKLFGFPIERDEHDKLTQCSKARYLVKRGRQLRTTQP